MGREFELKFAATPDILEAIQREFEGFSSISMETAYFDTPNGRLSDLRMTLRIRKENGTAVCTLKTPGDQHGRGEWEVLCQEIRQGIPLLLAAGCPQNLTALTADGLQEVCAARFTRLAKEILLPEGKAELALDQGFLLGGGRELPFWELEVEHKAGPEAATEAFARELAAKFHLVPQERSKFVRAMALARGE